MRYDWAEVWWEGDDWAEVWWGGGRRALMLRAGASIATDLQEKIPIQPELFIGHKVSKKQSTET